MAQSYRGGSVYSDGHSDGFSSTSSQWSTTYRKLPKKQKQSLSLRFLSWAAGAPPGATVVKKRTRDIPDDRSDVSGWTNRSYWSQPDTHMYWVVTPDEAGRWEVLITLAIDRALPISSLAEDHHGRNSFAD